MRLQIQNIGKIKYADLKLDGITVIAGNNNTGKSTVGKTVFALFNSLFRIGEKLFDQRVQLINTMLDRKLEELYMHQEGGHYRISYRRSRACSRELVNECKAAEQRRIIVSLLSIIREEENEKFISEIMEELKRINNLPDEELIRKSVTAYYTYVFNYEVNNVYRRGEDARVISEIKGKNMTLLFQDNACTEIRGRYNILNEAVYLDNPFVIDFLNDGDYMADALGSVTLRKLNKKKNTDDSVVQQSYVEDKMQEILAAINSVSSGSIYCGESGLYSYKEGGVALNVNNLSAGLKSFVIIKTLLENGELNEKDVLILDEPEIHLHPEWQLIFAEMIVLLQKTFDLTIVLTTHSVHFLEALQLFAKKYELDEKCNYYMALAEQDGCVLKDAEGDITDIYSQLVDPSITLDKLRYEMEDTEDE